MKQILFLRDERCSSSKEINRIFDGVHIGAELCRVTIIGLVAAKFVLFECGKVTG